MEFALEVNRLKLTHTRIVRGPALTSLVSLRVAEVLRRVASAYRTRPVWLEPMGM